MRFITFISIADVPSNTLALHKFIIVFFTICAMVSSTSCKDSRKVLENKTVFYTCSMHPQIMETHAGKCPICGMALIQVQKSDTPKSNELQLSVQQMQLGNIHVDTIGNGVMENEIVLNATLNYDMQKLTAVSSKVMGRVEKLYHKSTGDYIQKGQPLMDVYSEELNNAKQEFLLALEKRKVLDSSIIDFEQLITSAKTKLLLWGMNENQINKLAIEKDASPTTTVYSTETGFVTEISSQEGEYVNEGTIIVKLADLSTLWAEAQIYTSQFSKISENGNATVQVPDINKDIRGKIEFVNPEINAEKRISLIRVAIPNSNNQLKPGMLATVKISGGRFKVLSLPIDAVLRNAGGASVWVETAKNTFENKMVTVGMETGERIEVTSGLTEGEFVVIKGAYLINSEYIFKNGLSTMGGVKM